MSAPSPLDKFFRDAPERSEGARCDNTVPAGWRTQPSRDEFVEAVRRLRTATHRYQSGERTEAVATEGRRAAEDVDQMLAELLEE